MDERVEKALIELDAVDAQTTVEVARGVELRRKASGILVATLHYSADPRRDPETPEGAAWVKKQRADYPTQGDWDREQEIDDLAGGGELMLNPLLSKFKDLIVITDQNWMPDPRWDCVEGFDHGASNPTALEKMYIDFNGDRYLCGEYYNWRRDHKGHDPGWSNEIRDNAPYLLALHNLKKPRWTMADPSIFNQKSQAQKDGTFTYVVTSYREQGVRFLSPYPDEGTRSDESYMTRLREHWGGLEEPGRQPTLYIVCRPHLDTGYRQPGLHPYDCPNLLWEWRRRKRVQLTDRQLLARNQSEKLVDKDNHACDAHKYMEMRLPRPTPKPIEMLYEEQIAKPMRELLASRGQAPMNPMSEAVAMSRFLSLGNSGIQQGRSVNLRPKRRMPLR
jgi:hypothetical protein